MSYQWAVPWIEIELLSVCGLDWDEMEQKVEFLYWVKSANRTFSSRTEITHGIPLSLVSVINYYLQYLRVE